MTRSRDARLASTPNLGPTQTKYEALNPILRYANHQYFATIRNLLRSVSAESLLDAGAGEGAVLSDIGHYGIDRVVALDIDPERSSLAKASLTNTHVVIGDAHDLPFGSNSFDLVLLLEVLEHLGDPEAVVKEVQRVTKRYVLGSVPHEPWWRFGNMLRLKYWRDWGNTPEHVNHWSSRGFQALVSSRFNILKVAHPFLWTFVLAEKVD